MNYYKNDYENDYEKTETNIKSLEEIYNFMNTHQSLYERIQHKKHIQYEHQTIKNIICRKKQLLGRYFL